MNKEQISTCELIKEALKVRRSYVSETNDIDKLNMIIEEDIISRDILKRAGLTNQELFLAQGFYCLTRDRLKQLRVNVEKYERRYYSLMLKECMKKSKGECMENIQN